MIANRQFIHSLAVRYSEHIPVGEKGPSGSGDDKVRECRRTYGQVETFLNACKDDNSAWIKMARELKDSADQKIKEAREDYDYYSVEKAKSGYLLALTTIADPAIAVALENSGPAFYSNVKKSLC